MERGAGILMPIFSLPSEYGIGTFGKESKKFVDFLKESKIKYWQILPLNPTSYGDSPYQSFSAYALNPYFIDLEALITKKLLTKEDCSSLYQGKNYNEYIDYGNIYEKRFPILRKSYENAKLDEKLMKKVRSFEKKNKAWIYDYALFMVAKNLNNGDSYLDWSDEKLRKHDKKAVEQLKQEHEDDYYFWVYLQYLCDEQYNKLKKYANKNGILIIGDIPIYVALDSADTWANYEEFLLDKDRRPTLVAGVPPDYFSADGQLWGNPLYDYKHMHDTDFRWWKKRVKHCKKLYDVLRIDHFRGMESYYTIPFGMKNARIGEWVKGPGMELVNAIKVGSDNMDIIAEDLGYLTQEVVDLKNNSNWPGLKIFEFGFDGCDINNEHLPTFWTENCVAYTGTHDNDTIQGYIDNHKESWEFMMNFLKVSSPEMMLDKILSDLFASKAMIAICTMQDLLRQGSAYRINIPGTLGCNWKVRVPKDYAKRNLQTYLSNLVINSAR